MLKGINITAGFGGLEVLHGIDVAVRRGEIVTVLGPNGAGKSTLARVLAGLHKASLGQVSANNTDVTRLSAHQRMRLGIALVPENRALFPGQTVADNLVLGTYRRNRDRRMERLGEVLDLFPRLRERLAQPSGLLSGGEQQMLAIGRALMSSPDFLILDEPSLGLAPVIVRDIFDQFRGLAEGGTGILLNEQNAIRALEVADYAIVIERGHVVLSGTAAEISSDPRVIASYLGEVV